jgi:hypothetical protein
MTGVERFFLPQPPHPQHLKDQIQLVYCLNKLLLTELEDKATAIEAKVANKLKESESAEAVEDKAIICY